MTKLYKRQQKRKYKTRKEIAEELYAVNSCVSIWCISEKYKPTTQELEILNRQLGEVIKDLRRYQN
jgi:hypothetical protein